MFPSSAATGSKPGQFTDFSTPYFVLKKKKKKKLKSLGSNLSIYPTKANQSNCPILRIIRDNNIHKSAIRIYSNNGDDVKNKYKR